jgi:hypothetical protein
MCRVAVMSTVYRTSQCASGMLSAAVKSICTVVSGGTKESCHQFRRDLFLLFCFFLESWEAKGPSLFSLTSRLSSAPMGAGLGAMSIRVTSTVTPSAMVF